MIEITIERESATMVTNNRQADYEIDPIYLERWSPRGFSEKEVDEETLFSLFEAARWAPSAGNLQPWRFIIARTKEDREKFYQFIADANVEWCRKAPVLVAIVSKKIRNEKGAPNATHAFDTGAAWGFLALEAVRKGLITHGMGGIDREKAKEVLNIPKEFDVQAIIAIGYFDPDAELSEDNRKREVPSNRQPVKEFVYEGSFKE